MKSNWIVALLILSCALPLTAQVPQAKHVFLLVEENQSYSAVMNGGMPFLDSLAQQYAVATNYYANTHPSIGNYFVLTTGQILTNNDSYAGTENVDNIVRRLVAAGKTWKSYAESIPSPGYVGDNTGKYLKRHNPFAYFTDVVNNPAQRRNIVPFTQLATDMRNNTLPDYAFIAPNRCNDAHDCPISTADDWLKANIAPLIDSPLFQDGGLLIITFDESFTSDRKLGGGHIATVIIGPRVKRGFKSSSQYQHQSMLRLTMEALGLNSFPGMAASAPSMAEFFATSAAQQQ